MLGFPTGVACGGEVANIYLHELLWYFIQHYLENYIMLYLRYIDDMFIIWSSVVGNMGDWLTSNESSICPPLPLPRR